MKMTGMMLIAGVIGGLAMVADANDTGKKLSLITDGDKEHDSETYVELAPVKQWVQIDLDKADEIYAFCVWHCPRTKWVM